MAENNELKSKVIEDTKEMKKSLKDDAPLGKQKKNTVEKIMELAKAKVDTETDFENKFVQLPTFPLDSVSSKLLNVLKEKYKQTTDTETDQKLQSIRESIISIIANVFQFKRDLDKFDCELCLQNQMDEPLRQNLYNAHLCALNIYHELSKLLIFMNKNVSSNVPPAEPQPEPESECKVEALANLNI
ncbi:PREDICTED: uncharacterized protein LOC105455321 isoform X1 [Wasmannia auropunctata]|uniref:uncharacterized protein LOC105455321 isoform X1 n=1 Tax=Wasmannia auropunctata TaxID=64793 RepID=UPI0005EDDAFF|nr:PREDICTED: uncharacterized protein LOC105455321 isoform X1 [Wasmannia auropunctata]